MLVFLCLSKFPSKNGHLEHSPRFFLATFQINSVPLSVDSLCNSWLHSAGEESGPALGAKGIDSFSSKTESSKLSLLVLFPGLLIGDFYFFFRGIISSVSLYHPSALLILRMIGIRKSGKNDK